MAFSVNNAPLAIGANVTPLNTPLENQIGMVKLQQVKQLAIDQEKQRQTADAFQKALQTTSGDYDSAADLLDKQGYDTLGLRNSLADYRDKLQKGAKAHLDSQKVENELMSSAFSKVTDQATWDAAKPVIARIDPDFVKIAGDTFDPQKFEVYKGIGVSAADQHKMAEDALQSFAKGDKAHGLALAVAGTTSDEDLKGALQYAQVNGAPAYLLQKYQGVKWSPELVTAAKTEAIGPEKSAELADKQAAGVRADAREERMAAAQQQQLGMERQRLGLEGARVGMERQRMNAENQATTAAIQASNPNAPHGEEFLKSLPSDAIRAQVKALDEGRMQFPGSMALKTPYWQQMLSNVAQYDPNFDQVNYNSRAATRKDFTSGKSAQQINAINTAIGHLSQLSDLADALHNKDWNTYNSITNAMATEFGWTGKTDYDTVLGRVAPEITRVWRGTGGNESDIKRDIDTLNSSRGAGQIHGSIANLGDMLKSKIDSSAEQYAQGMGTKPVEMTTPQAAATLSKLSKRAGRSESSSAPAGYQVDQVVSVKGKPIKITKVNTDGTFEGLPQ